MKSANQAIENVEYVRRLLEQKQPGFAASLECAASLVETQPREPTDDELIRRCSAAVRVACLRMNPRYLKALRDSVEQACRMPSRFTWDRKAAAHAEIFDLLADVAGDAVPAVPLTHARRRISDLMGTAGPAADGIILSSRRRLLAQMRARDADSVACEMEQHLGGLLCMRRLSRSSAWSGIAVCLPHLTWRAWSPRNFRQVTFGGGIDVVEAQKMEPIPAHEIICNNSVVHEWRVAQLTRLGIPTPLTEAVAADVDWHQVAALVHRGCPPWLALRIVR